jgi:hypothetical protein
VGDVDKGWSFREGMMCLQSYQQPEWSPGNLGEALASLFRCF